MTTWKMVITATVAGSFLLMVGAAPAAAQQSAQSPAPSAESKVGGPDSRDGAKANAERSGNIGAPQRSDDAAVAASPRTVDNNRSFNFAWLLVPLALLLAAFAFRSMRRNRTPTRDDGINQRM